MTGISESGTRHFAIDSSNWGSVHSWGLAIAAYVVTLHECRVALNCKKIHSEGKKLPLTARITAFRCH